MVRTNKTRSHYDVIIIGGGFYGSMIALYMREHFRNILIIEKEQAIITKASYNNQARVHNGYHYPRNFITALRSHMNYSRFLKEFSDAIEDSHIMLYAIARGTSKSTVHQFIRLCNRIGSPLKPVQTSKRKLFNELLIEDIFMVDEVVFNAAKIRQILASQFNNAQVDVILGKEVTKVTEDGTNQKVVSFIDGDSLSAHIVINCAYANINRILDRSGLDLLPLKYEFAEMPIVSMPDALRDVGITIMDGPFFSIMPFPDKKLHSFHHVRYTPHASSLDRTRIDAYEGAGSKFTYMRHDAERYVPILKDLQYKESIYEVKTVLMQNEENDGRPILFRKDYGLKNFHVVMGGKLDNIYDIYNKLDRNL